MAHPHGRALRADGYAASPSVVTGVSRTHENSMIKFYRAQESAKARRRERERRYGRGQAGLLSGVRGSGRLPGVPIPIIQFQTKAKPNHTAQVPYI